MGGQLGAERESKLCAEGASGLALGVCKALMLDSSDKFEVAMAALVVTERGLG